MVIQKGFSGSSAVVTNQDTKALTPELVNALRQVFLDDNVLIALNTDELIYMINTYLPTDLHIDRGTLNRFIKDKTSLTVQMLPLYSEVRGIILEALMRTKLEMTRRYMATNKFGEMRKFEFIMLNKFKDWGDKEDTAQAAVGDRFTINIQNNSNMLPITSEAEMIALNEGT